jgi:hypothetical protein
MKEEQTAKNPQGQGQSAVERFVSWLFINSAFGVCAVLGLFYQRVWAKNILLFGVWTFALLMTVAAMSPDVQRLARKKGRSVPQWLSVGFDVALIVALAAVGRFVAATVWFWQVLCEAHVYKESDEKTECS